MKKRIFSCIAVAMALAMSVVALCACNIFDDDSSSSSKTKNTSTTITVDVDGTAKTYTATFGNIVDLGVLTKEGYVFENATDDSGKIYFNEIGQSLTKWQEDYPTSFKANFKPVSGFSYTYSTTWENDPKTVHDSLYSALKNDYGCQNIVRRQLRSAVLGNTNADITIKVFFREKNDSSRMRGEFVFYILELTNESSIYYMSKAVTNTSYVEYNEVCNTKAYVVESGFRLCFTDTSTQMLGTYRNVKDVKVTITFK